MYKENGGACSARNKGIGMAEGEYVALLDCDDLYLPRKIEKSIAYLEENEDCGFVHTAAYFVDEEDSVVEVFSTPESRRFEGVAKKLLLRNFICNSTIVARRSCFEEAGLFDETIFMPADWDMWMRLAEKYEVGYIDKPLTSHRNPGSYILQHLQRSRSEELFVLEKAFKRNPDLETRFKDRAVSNVHYRHAAYYQFLN